MTHKSIEEYTAMVERLTDALSGKSGDIRTAIAQMAIELGVTLLDKNHDYGNSVFKPPMLAKHISPADAISVRMSDKVGRLVQLLAHVDSEDVLNEPIEDTFRDLAGYSLLELVRRRVQGWMQAKPSNSPEGT